jgi:16S rRNA (guanine527-N7)-methyltransferase
MFRHWEWVSQWNLTTNLTAVKTAEEAAWLHYYDSLQLLHVCTQEKIRLVDIGSGGGFPGIPLAIARPQWEVTLVEPRRKRVSFLTSAVARLGLKNVKVVEGRVEDVCTDLFDVGVTRATFSQDEDLAKCMKWIVHKGCFVAYQSADKMSVSGNIVRRYVVKNSQRVLVSWISDR